MREKPALCKAWSNSPTVRPAGNRRHTRCGRRRTLRRPVGVRGRIRLPCIPTSIVPSAVDPIGDGPEAHGGGGTEAARARNVLPPPPSPTPKCTVPRSPTASGWTVTSAASSGFNWRFWRSRARYRARVRRSGLAPRALRNRAPCPRRTRPRRPRCDFERRNPESGCRRGTSPRRRYGCRDSRVNRIRVGVSMSPESRETPQRCGSLRSRGPSVLRTRQGHGVPRMVA